MAFDAKLFAGKKGPDLRGAAFKAGEADEKLASAYQSLIGLKGAYDDMEEIPATLKASYSQVMKAMSAVAEARKETGQLKGMVAKIPMR